MIPMIILKTDFLRISWEIIIFCIKAKMHLKCTPECWKEILQALNIGNDYENNYSGKVYKDLKEIPHSMIIKIMMKVFLE